MKEFEDFLQEQTKHADDNLKAVENAFDMELQNIIRLRKMGQVKGPEDAAIRIGMAIPSLLQKYSSEFALSMLTRYHEWLTEHYVLTPKADLDNA